MRTINEIVGDIEKIEDTKKELEKELNDVLRSNEKKEERSNISMVGNVGEWSEIYVFYRVMETGKIKPASYDENGVLTEVKDAFLPVLKILREDEGFPIEYFTSNDLNGVKALKIYYGNRNEPLLSCSLEDFANKADKLLDILKSDNESKGKKGAVQGTGKDGKPSWRSFGIPEQKEFLNNIFITKLKSPATEVSKVFGGITDITMEILQNDNMRVPVAFSIKSGVKSLPALFNYSDGSNVVYELDGCDEETFKELCSINKETSKQYAVDRVRAIRKNKKITVRFDHFLGETFERNLRLVADRTNEVLAYAVLYSLDEPFEGERSNRKLKNVYRSLVTYDPLKIGAGSELYYEKRLKDFLIAKAGGMEIKSEWDGNIAISGGYIFVTKKGDVLAFYASDQNKYKEWLLNTTKFDTPSSSSGKSTGFADVYKENGKYFLKLNVLIKFLEN